MNNFEDPRKRKMAGLENVQSQITRKTQEIADAQAIYDSNLRREEEMRASFDRLGEANTRTPSEQAGIDEIMTGLQNDTLRWADNLRLLKDDLARLQELMAGMMGPDGGKNH